MPTAPAPIVLGLPGSIRAGSHSRTLLRALGSELTAQGAAFEVLEPIRDLPHYDADLDTPERLPDAVRSLRARLAEAAAIAIVTPEYNFALPGGLKNLLDWASRPMGGHCLVGRTVAVVGCTPGKRGGKAASDYLRLVLPLLGASLVGEELLVSGVDTLLDPATGAAEPGLRAQLADVARAITDAVHVG